MHRKSLLTDCGKTSQQFDQIIEFILVENNCSAQFKKYHRRSERYNISTRVGLFCHE